MRLTPGAATTTGELGLGPERGHRGPTRASVYEASLSSAQPANYNSPELLIKSSQKIHPQVIEEEEEEEEEEEK